ncbi:hypothetical protein [Aureliella helgolandensis]|uniref:Carboxypeptidase regulatory-like domain-containing protein n=1 Tax=Aureliella helgolandensis TaxID=2527968 RepID=A0A518GAH0_9BACT|nr:hypothetical protein [Aureliella helgolandensis]QDV25559.1 hypothetical protein Q31a_38850 [Aureliella helgolandensis]
MGVQDGNRRQSWRHASGSPVKAQGGSLAGRRMVSTICLVGLLLAAVLLVAFLSRQRTQHTLVVSLFSASSSNTSEPERSYTWPPLRFGSETLAPLTEESSESFQVTSASTAFDNAENLRVALEEQISELEGGDALVLWIRAKGASLEGRPYLLGGEYRLPSESGALAAPHGAIPFSTVLNAVGQWAGPVLILLDWGNQVSDVRSGMWSNQFLPLAVEELKQAPSQVHCLFSHQTGQLSLDALGSRQSIFGRACAEAMVGPRRAPEGYRSEVNSTKELVVGDVAEYVIRRVWTDSAERQKAWLAKGGTGWMSAERNVWGAQTTSSLARLGKNGRPSGWPNFTTETPEEAAQSQPAAIPQADETTLGIADWPTGPIWRGLDQWQASSSQFGRWNAASLAPLTARRIATMTMEVEQRWMSGDDFRGLASNDNLQSRVNAVLRSLEEEQKGIEESFSATSLDDITPVLLPGVSPAEVTLWYQRTDAVVAYRNLALILNDVVRLCDSVEQLEYVPVSAGLARATDVAIETVQDYLRSVPAADANALDHLPGSQAVRLTQRLRDCRQNIDASVAALLTQFHSQPESHRALAELISRYCWLSHDQRMKLWVDLRRLDQAPAEAGAGWPTMDLALLQAEVPQVKRAATTRWMELSKAQTADKIVGNALLVPSPAELVTQLSAHADKVRASRFSAVDWLCVDGRDLCQMEGNWSIQEQLPMTPTIPQPPASWRLAWANPVGGRLQGDRFELVSSSEPAMIELSLVRVGAADNIESIALALDGLQARVAGSQSSWQRGVLNLTAKDLLRVVNLSSDAQKLPLEIRPIGGEPQKPIRLQVRVQAGAAPAFETRLSCVLPVPVPVALAVQQQMRRDGQTRWETCSRQGDIVTLHPFPGRVSNFRFLVSNLDQQPCQASVEFYRLSSSSRAGVTAKGIISEIDGEVPLELEEQSLSKFRFIGRSPAHPLAPQQRDVVIDFAGAATASTDPPPAAVPPAADVATGEDVSWGLLAVVRLESEPTRSWKTWLQIEPVLATDYLTTHSTTSDDLQSVELTVELKDANRDGFPDLAPTDFSEERPIELECVIGAGIDPKRATVPQRRHVLTSDKPRQVFTISAESKIEREVELQVAVDGNPRALFEFVGVDGRAARREPPDRIRLHSIGVPEQLTYLTEYKPNLGEFERMLTSHGAMFRRPVEAPIEINLAIDSQARARSNAKQERVEFRLVGPTWGFDFGAFYGERDMTAALIGSPSNSFSLQCQLSDWHFSYDASSLGDAQAQFQGSMGGAEPRSLGKLILDGRGPVLAQSAKVSETVEGRTSRLSFDLADSVPIGKGKILYSPAGRPSLAQVLGEELTGEDFLPIAGGWQLRARTLPVQELAAASYDLRVELEDILGNASELGPWTLKINPKPAGPGEDGGQPLIGDVRGKLVFGNGQNKPPNPVKVSVKDRSDLSVTSGSGEYVLVGIEAGEYTLQAQMIWQGVVYQGEVAVKLLKQEDYLKPVNIPLAKE